MPRTEADAWTVTLSRLPPSWRDRVDEIARRLGLTPVDVIAHMMQYCLRDWERVESKLPPSTGRLPKLVGRPRKRREEN